MAAAGCMHRDKFACADLTSNSFIRRHVVADLAPVIQGPCRRRGYLGLRSPATAVIPIPRPIARRSRRRVAHPVRSTWRSTPIPGATAKPRPSHRRRRLPSTISSDGGGGGPSDHTAAVGGRRQMHHGRTLREKRRGDPMVTPTSPKESMQAAPGWGNVSVTTPPRRPHTPRRACHDDRDDCPDRRPYSGH